MTNEEFVDLLGRHQVQLMGYIYALVHNMDDAEDLYQQSSLVLWRKFDQFDANTDFFRWASTIARYEVMNFLRTRATRRQYFSDRFMELLANDRTPDVNSHMELRRQALAGCVKKLSQSDRRLVEMCYSGHLLVKDAAAALRRPAKSVSDSLSRIRRTLYECINRTLAQGGEV